MKKFLLRLCIYLVVLLAIATVLQVIISVRIKNKVLFGSDNLYAVKGQKNAIVFLGNSRCYNQYDPHFFHDSLGINSVNLGIEGHADLIMHTIRLKYYLAYNPPPKLVLISFDPFMNAGAFNVQKQFTRKDYFSRYAFLPNEQDKMVDDYFGFNFFEKYVPLYALLKYQLLVKCISPYKKTAWETRGYPENTSTWDTVAYPPSYAMLDATNAYATFKKYYDSIKMDLQSLNNICKKNNIKLICIQMPVYKNIYIKDAFDLVTKMCNESGIIVINTNADDIISNPAYFADPHHMNNKGVPQALDIIIKNKQFLEALKSQ
jgi:hypothetical protein